jgi:hypothetical protein
VSVIPLDAEIPESLFNEIYKAWRKNAGEMSLSEYIITLLEKAAAKR